MIISGWDKWQTYRKDRGTPPWIKVYRNLFSNSEWASLSDSEKGQLVSIWILAADKHGVIPDDPLVLQKMCMLDEPPNISKFKDLRFVSASCQPNDNQVVTICQGCDAPETETETETEQDTAGAGDSVSPEKEIKFQALKFLTDLEVAKQIASDFLKCRRVKRLANTETAFTDIQREIVKTNRSANDIIKICTEKGWGGFKSSWKIDEEEDQIKKYGICGPACFSYKDTCKPLGKNKDGQECSACNTH